MRSMLLVLLVPVFALAVSNMPTVDIVAPEEAVQPGEPVITQETSIEPGEPAVLVGTVDTIGGTTYDWVGNGNIYRFIANSPDYGVHVAWMYSAHTGGTTFPDRNMRYNFYDYSAGWNWIDPDYMQSGVNVFTERCGYGNLAADPTSGVAVVPSHLGTPLRIEAARDMAPGAGIFEYCTGSPTLEGYLWPPLDVDMNSAIHIGCIEDVGDRDNVYYANGATWCNWTSPVRMAPPQPDPSFPTQGIAASKVSDNVCLTWVYSPDGYSQKPGFYRISTDGGATWDGSTQLSWPPAYQGDTLPSYHITSLFPFYDSNDNLHIAAGVSPFVRDTNYILPAEIWHWDQSTDVWSRVHRADPESLMAAIGYNASMACRASIGEDNDGNLYVAWEEFDGVNVEAQTNLLRGDIWVAGSDDGGATWHPGVRLTGPGAAVSHRFPSIIDMAVEGGFATDTVMIFYEIDQVAGFFVQGEGPATNNAMVVHKVWGGDIIPDAVKEKPKAGLPNRIEMTAKPNPFGRSTTISYTLPKTTDVTLAIYDEAGRPVEALRRGQTGAGRHTATWNAGEVPAGVYFYKLHAGDETLSDKLIVSR